MMNRVRGAMIGMVLVGLGWGVPAVAQEAEKADTKVIVRPAGGEIDELRAEIAAMKREMEALRNEIKVLRDELKTAKSLPPKPQPPKREADTTVYDVKIEGSPARGPANAKVTIVEFADFQCPFCIREWPKLKAILDEYPNDVRLVFKHFPLTFHKKARPVHAATALAAQEKGSAAFWKMHDKIIADPKKLEVSDLRGYAEELGLNLGKFEAVLTDPAQIEALLKGDLEEANKCKVGGTPTILINGVKLADRNPEGYKARIEEILKGGGPASDKPKPAAELKGEPEKATR